LHGVWPPPETREEQPQHRNGASRRHQPFGRPHQHSFDQFNDNFMFNSYSSPFGGRGFAYTDPFTLFDSIFGNLNRFSDPSFHHHHHGDSHSRWESPFYSEPERLFQEVHDFVDNTVPSGFPRRRAHTHMFPVIPSNGPPPTILFQRAESRTYPQNGHWTQESRVTSTVNGVTQSIWKRRDADVCLSFLISYLYASSVYHSR
jgi:DnaJ family protein B protein 6